MARNWFDCMQSGDFSAAWEISDRALRDRANVPCWHLPRHQQYFWNGESPAGKRVLIRCYHGLGDTVQFIRYAPLLRRQAREIIVWAQPSLVSLLDRTDGVDRVLPLHDGQPETAYDLDVEVMELPHLFRSSLDDLPAGVPYLHSSPAATPPRSDDPTKFHVGLVWRAGDWDTRRSVPLPLLASLAEVPGVALHALQRGSTLADWRAEYGENIGSDDVETTAAQMKSLDLIVSVDSFPAHLAGALGRPIWTLLHSTPDWRWMNTGSRSPWYPTMRLFRQAQAGDWEAVVGQVAAELRALTDRERPAQPPVALG